MNEFYNGLSDLERFIKSDPTQYISKLENLLRERDLPEIKNILVNEQNTESILKSALIVKNIAGQINVIIHALGIMASLPHILKEDEIVQSISLGAGNDGKKTFDLVTTNRIAEFKFMHWKGSPEAIRQNQLFKDLFALESFDSQKDKYLYLIGIDIPLKFLENSKRNLDSVLSKNESVKKEFYNIYGSKYKTVSSYYHDIKNKVKIRDLTFIVPMFSNYTET